MQRRLLISLIVLAGGAALVAGCGGSDATAPSSSAGAPAAANGGTSTPVSGGATNNGAAGDAVGAEIGAQANDTGSSSSSSLPFSKGDELGGFGVGRDGLFSHAKEAVETTNSSQYSGSGYDDTTINFDSSSSSSSSSSSTSTAKTYTSARISVQAGSATVATTYTLRKGSVFPSDSQLFQVTRIGASTVDVDLTAGVLTNGGSGWTLTKGKAVTVLNRNEGLTYKILLVTTS